VVTEAAYARCLEIAQRHYENFPVASRLLPRRARPHIAAIYAFARIADDFADEGTRSAAARLALLDDWQVRLHKAAVAPKSDDDSDASAIFHALGDSIRQCRLEVRLFDDLLSAFRQDVTVHRYETWDALLDYCRRSANPVGRLVLRVNGYHDERLDACSDAVCTALQLTNFWQDLEVDLKKDRLYVPLTEVQAAGANIEDLRRFRLTPEWRRVMEAAGARTRALFAAGRPVADSVRGRLRWELRATWLGGMRILDRLAAGGYDVFTARPKLGKIDAVVIAGRALTWRAGTASLPAGTP
jgi:phytoene synthase